VGHRNGLEDVERRKILPLPGLELRPLGRPARGLEPSRNNSVIFTSSSLTVRKRTPETFFNVVTKINMYNIKTLLSEV
jgi:hypothetical protein